MIEIYDIKDCLDDLENVMDIIYEEWGKFFKTSKEEKISKIKRNIENNELFPKIYVLKENNIMVGSFTIKEYDLENSELSPWLACVIVEKSYRGKGYGNILLKYIKNVIDRDYEKIHLFTNLDNFYEKINFKHLKNINHNGELNKLYLYERE